MLGIHHFWLFLASGVLLNLTPGQDTLYIVGRSIAQGRRAGIFSALGIQAGCVVHTVAAAFGLSAVLATSANAYTVVKVAGAAYLAFLGVQLMFRQSAKTENSDCMTPESDWRVFRAGLITNVFNPKVALFYLAFLPQFIEPAASSKVLAFLLLGSVFICTNTVWCLTLATGAAVLAKKSTTANVRAGSWIRRATGALFLGLGLRLAFSR